MPHSYFNTRFVTGNSTVAEVSYPGRTYFIPVGTEGMARQLRDFRASPVFAIFREEYDELLDALNLWCFDQGIQEWQIVDDTDEDSDELPSFQIFKSRLLEEDYYDVRAALFFNTGKKLLEQLLLLLSNASIPLESKKNALVNLQIGIVVCADGTLTNIVDAVKELNAFSGVDALIENTKRILIQQKALAYIKKTHLETGINEIHYVNTYCNHVAARYGLPLKEDGITVAGVSQDTLQSFARVLERQLTPEIVLHYLINEINKELLALRAALNKEFFSDAIQIAYTPDFQEKTNRLVDDWNQRHAALFSLDLHALILLSEEIIDDQLQCSLAPHNEAWVHAKVIAGFRKLFLSEKSQRIIFKIDKDTSLFCDNGIFWIEQAGQYLFCTPELFARIAYPQDTEAGFDHKTYFVLLRKLIDQLPNNPLLTGILCKHNSFDLLKYRAYSLYEHMLANDLITPEGLMLLSQTGSNIGKNIVWDLVIHQQYHLLEQIIEKNLMSPQMLNIAPGGGREVGKNSIWQLVFAREYTLLERIMAWDLMSSEALLMAPRQGLDAGKNSFWLLLHDLLDSSDDRILFLVEQLIEKNLVTQEMLLNKPGVGPNSAQMLVLAKQYGLLKNIISQNLMTHEILSGVSIWKIAAARQFDLLGQLLTKNLLTTAQIMAGPSKGKFAGKNTLVFLADAHQLALLQELLAKRLITKRQFDGLSATKADNTTRVSPPLRKRSQLGFFGKEGLVSDEDAERQEPPLARRRVETQLM